MPLVPLVERSADDDHFYGAWTKGGGRAAPSSTRAVAAQSKKRAPLDESYPRMWRAQWVQGDDSRYAGIARSNGMTVDQYESKANKNLRRVLDKATVRVAVKGDFIDEILADGRVKNQHETGQSGGAYDISARIGLEEDLFGYPRSLPGAARPVYGFLQEDLSRQVWPAVDGYGDVILNLKDSVKSRTTVTWEDSFSTGLATRVNEPTIAGYKFGVIPETGWDGPAEAGPAPHLLKSVDELVGATQYVEAQIHGGLLVSDIASATLINPTPAVLSMLKRARIPTVQLKEAGDDDHFYGAWTKGGGRAAPSSTRAAAALAKPAVATGPLQVPDDEMSYPGGYNPNDTHGSLLTPNDKLYWVAASRDRLKAIRDNAGVPGTVGNKIMTQIEEGILTLSPVYRGIRTTENAGAYSVANYRPGQTVDLQLSSFSTSRDEALAYARNDFGRQNESSDKAFQPSTSALIRVEAGAGALDIGPTFKGNPGNEVITAGRFQVVSVENTEVGMSLNGIEQVVLTGTLPVITLKQVAVVG